MYSPAPDGYCGDEDNGQTSAWYVFSAIGFYPVCPGTDQYILGSPLFKKMTLKLENGKELVINAENNSADNKYIDELTINKKYATQNWISHQEIMKGMILNFKMSPTPNKKRGVAEKDFPYSISTNEK
jgi:putative alpha-1,2-mannosidase